MTASSPIVEIILEPAASERGKKLKKEYLDARKGKAGRRPIWTPDSYFVLVMGRKNKVIDIRTAATMQLALKEGRRILRAHNLEWDEIDLS